MSDEYAEYEVPGRQLRYRAAQLNTAGIPFQVNPVGGGVYIILIPMAYAGGMDSLPQPQRRHRRAWWMPSRRMLVTLAMVAVAGVGVYMVLSGGIHINGLDVSSVQLPSVELPSVTAPLDGAAASVERAAESAKSAAMSFLYAVGALLIMTAMWFLRGPLAMAGRGLGSLVHGVGSLASVVTKAVKRG